MSAIFDQGEDPTTYQLPCEKCTAWSRTTKKHGGIYLCSRCAGCCVCSVRDGAALGQYMKAGEVVSAHLKCAQQAGLVGVDGVDE